MVMPRKKRRTILALVLIAIVAILLGVYLLLYNTTDMFKSEDVLFNKYVSQLIENIYPILNEENIFVFIMIIVIFVGAFIFPKVNNMYTVNRVEKTIKEQGYENVQYISILNNTAIKIFFDEEIHFGAYCFRAHKGDKEYDIIVNVEGGKIIDYSEDGSNDFMDLLIEGEG